MSTEATAPPPAYPPMPSGPPRGAHEPIKVKVLRFARQGVGEGVSLGDPFPSNPVNLPAGKFRGSEDLIQIQYEPWHRQYRVRYVERGVKVTGERCIPESWAIYEPEPT